MPPAIVIDCPKHSDTGAYRVSWIYKPAGETGELTRSQPARRFLLEENDEQLYQGPHLATSVSGRPAGDYAYRVGLLDSGGAAERDSVDLWSEACVVHVEPPSMTLALSLFGLGLLVFVATVALVVSGHRAHRRGENLP